MNYLYIKDKMVERTEAVLSVFDLAVLRGYGVFDFFKVLKGVPIFIEDHINRFFYSSEQLHLQSPLNKEELIQTILELIEKNNLENGTIKLILTGGESSNGYNLDAAPTLLILPGALNFTVYDDFATIKRLKLKTLNYVRETPEIKSTNYIISMMHWPEITAGGYDDFLFVKNGFVSESSRANFFIISHEEKLITPDIDVLHGITRKHVLDIASKIMPVEIRPITLEETLLAKEAFLTSTTKQTMPVVEIDTIAIGNNKPFTWTNKIFDSFHTLEMDFIKNFNT